MTRFVIKKLYQSIITIFIATLLIFVVIRLMGDPSVVYVPQTADPEAKQEFITRMGLDKPVAEQFVMYIVGLLHGDLGESFSTKGPVSELIGSRLPNTLKLAGATMFFAILLAFIEGLLSVIYRNKFLDKILMLFYSVGQSTPMFLLMIVAIHIFSVKLGVLPASGMEGISSYIMPVGISSILLSTILAPILRASMLDSLKCDYVKMARLKGVGEKTIVVKHCLINSIPPMLSMISVMFASQLTGTLIVESIFAWPGIGFLAYQSIMQRDFPAIQGLVIVMTAMVIIVNIVADLIQAAIDPRIRL